MLTIEEFTRINHVRCVNGFKHNPSDWSLSDWVTAVAGELGEAANIVKKLNRIRDGVPGNAAHETESALHVMLADELADVQIYLNLFMTRLGIDVPASIVSKFNRTSAKIGSDITLSVE